MSYLYSIKRYLASTKETPASCIEFAGFRRLLGIGNRRPLSEAFSRWPLAVDPLDEEAVIALMRTRRSATIAGSEDSSAPSVAWVVVRAVDFALVAGQPVAYRSSPPVVHVFIEMRNAVDVPHDHGPETIGITTASFDSPQRFARAREVWLQHKLASEPVDEALPHVPRSSTER